MTSIAGPASAAERHTVKSGDTVERIARRYGVNWRALARQNGLASPYRVVIGQTLNIPAGGGGGAASGQYLVRKGDNVARIARRAGVSSKSIIDANGLKPPYVVRPGQSLAIGNGAAAEAAKTGSTNQAIVVRKGETLNGLARRNNTTPGALAAANGISNPNRIREGQRLVLSTNSPSTPPPSTKQGALLPNDGVTASMTKSAPRQQVKQSLEKWAGRYGLPTDLVKGLAWQESGWKSNVVSSAGAVGVMQLMPATAQWLGDKLTKRSIDRFNAEHNIEGGAAYLDWLLKQNNGDERLALASYYQGLGAVRKHGLYDESEVYVKAVQAARKLKGG